ncbi:MAG: putative N-acetylmannosamine-6-phosphate 2-epimerase [Terriglobia bacterium]|jgi:glucokinase
MNSFLALYPDLRGRLIVSCQAPEGSAFREPSVVARFAKAAADAGAAGIRANGPDDIRAICKTVAVPIIGIWKILQADGKILITPTFEAARELLQAGASMIALDCTLRGQRSGALERLQRIRADLGVPVLADIATVEEAVQAVDAGADAVLSTLRGYTPETQHISEFDPSFIAELCAAVDAPVIAEGRIQTPRQAGEAIDAGAFAIIVGRAITEPDAITRRFVMALDARQGHDDSIGCLIGIDLGGTRTKYGLVSRRGDLIFHGASATPWDGGRQSLLYHLKDTATCCLEEAQRRNLRVDALGIATAGWVDPNSGAVAYATENLPGWTGTQIGTFLRDALNLPVAVENDANALAIAEKYFGAAKGAADFICITLGTGVGGGCFIGGQLNRGRHFLANAIGHISIQPDGPPCTCGLSGCLEYYTNAAALMRYAGHAKYTSPEEIIDAANSGDVVAYRAIQALARYLAIGCASVVGLLDPDMLILAGGLVQNNPILLKELEDELSKRVTAWPQRKLQVQTSPLGYSAGVLGAAAVALDRLSEDGGSAATSGYLE